MSNVRGKVFISFVLSQSRDYLEIKIGTEDGQSLTPQVLIDILSDYLLMDPKGYFTNENLS